MCSIGGASPRTKAIINIIGTVLFLLPFTAMILWFSWRYTANAWQVREASSNAGGLPYVYLLKTLIPVFAAMLILQGIAELCRNILILSGKIVPREEH